MRVQLSQIATWVDGVLIGDDKEITAVSNDSREIQFGGLFVALPGTRDGHEFLTPAFTRGALAAMVSQNFWDSVDQSIFLSTMQVRLEEMNSPAGSSTERSDSSLIAASLEYEISNEDFPTASFDTTNEVRLSLIIVNDPMRAWRELATKWYELHRGHLTTIGITGSVGKTTTKDLLAHILGSRFSVVAPRNSYNNEIGVPLTIFQVETTTQILILELGAYKVGDIKHLVELVSLDLATITRIGKTHLATFGSIKGIIQAKSEIFDSVIYGGIVVLNPCDIHLRGIHIRSDLKQVQAKPYFAITDFSQWLKSSAILEDLNLAATCALQLGLTLPQVRQSLQAKPIFSHHRLHIFPYGKSQIIDDTYNANPDSMQAALTMFQNFTNSVPKIAVLGPMLELGESTEIEHYKLGKAVRAAGVGQLYWVGDYYGAVVAGFSSDHIQHLESLDQVQDLLRKLSQQSNAILLKASYGIKLWEVVERLEDQA